MKKTWFVCLAGCLACLASSGEVDGRAEMQAVVDAYVDEVVEEAGDARRADKGGYVKSPDGAGVHPESLAKRPGLLRFCIGLQQAFFGHGVEGRPTGVSVAAYCRFSWTVQLHCTTPRTKNLMSCTNTAPPLTPLSYPRTLLISNYFEDC